MTEARCNFCGKSFRNRQAVRAHLRGCPDYRHVPKAAVPSTGSQPRTIGLRGAYPGLLRNPNSAEPAGAEGSSLGGRIQAERERLELRRLKDANRELEAGAGGCAWTRPSSRPTSTAPFKTPQKPVEA